MLQHIVGAVREFFAPVVRDSEAFAQLKTKHPVGQPQLATMGQAYRLLAEIGIGTDQLDQHDEHHDPTIGRCPCGRRWKAGDKGAPVGQLREVARLFEPHHAVGMEVSAGEGGWTYERLDTRSGSYEAFRRHGRLRGFQLGFILRTESRGPIRIR